MRKYIFIISCQKIYRYAITTLGLGIYVYAKLLYEHYMDNQIPPYLRIFLYRDGYHIYGTFIHYY